MNYNLIMEAWRKHLNEGTNTAELIPVKGGLDDDGHWQPLVDMEESDIPQNYAAATADWWQRARWDQYDGGQYAPLHGKHIWEYFGRMPNTYEEYSAMYEKMITDNKNMLRGNNPNPDHPDLLDKQTLQRLERQKVALKAAGKEYEPVLTFEQALASYIKQKLPNVKFDPRNPTLAFTEINNRAGKHIETSPGPNLYAGKCTIADGNTGGQGKTRYVFDPKICYNANNLDVFKALIDAASGTGPAGTPPGNTATAPSQKPPVAGKFPPVAKTKI